MLNKQGTLRVANLADGRKAIIIRTSDRINFKKCRRSWAWSSHMKGNWGSNNLASALWFGSAIHFALEDLHGYKKYASGSDAFKAYCIATSKQHQRDLPHDAMALYKMGTSMMDYYEYKWLKARREDKTFWLDGIPQVEVDFQIEVPLEEYPHLIPLMQAHDADCVLYCGTIDRVAEDEFGRLWVVEYKTAKVMEQQHYQTDPQVTTYAWAARNIYAKTGKEVAGIIYMQFLKKDIEALFPLKTTGKISTASTLSTSAIIYREALEAMYGDVTKAPQANIDYLTNLMIKEDENRDKYVMREYIYRNEHMCEMEAQKILLELEDMLNPDLPLYPNPTRECARMCSFVSPCVSFDDGSDWEDTLSQRFSQRDQDVDKFWRRRLPSMDKMLSLRLHGGTPDLEEMQVTLQNMSEADRAAIERGEEEIGFTFSM